MWTESTLGETCKMYQPKTISSKEMVDNGDYPVFGANGIIGRFHQYNHKEPQLLITCRGATCGAVNISEPFSWINGNAMVIQPSLEKVSLKYMEYVFKGGINLSKAITGSAQPQITRKSLEKISFSYPQLAEQQSIVAKLDAVFAEIDLLRSKCQTNLETVDKFENLIIDNYFNGIDQTFECWKDCTLQDLLIDRPRNGFSPPKNLQSEHGIPVLTLSSVTGNNFNPHKIIYTKSDLKKKAHYWIKNGDLLITRSNTRQLVGHVAVVKDIDEPTIYPDLIMKINCKEKEVLTMFLFYYLQTSKIRNYITKKAKGANPTMVKINQEIVKNIPIRIPSLEVQKQVTNKFQELSRHINLYKNKLNRKLRLYDDLRISILTQTLTGFSRN